MTLHEYLKERKLPGEVFAKRLGISTASVSRIRKGRQNITLELAQRIVAETGGKVSLEELVMREAA